MNESQGAILLRRLDYVSEAIQTHARDDLALHNAVLAKIDQKSEVDKIERAKLSRKLDEIAGLVVVWNTAKGLRSIIIVIGKLALAVAAIGAAIKFFLTWGRW